MAKRTNLMTPSGRNPVADNQSRECLRERSAADRQPRQAKHV